MPITTKFIRARAKYDYLLEKSYNVVVVQAPATTEKKSGGFDTGISDQKYTGIFFNSASSNERQYSPIVLEAAKRHNIDYLFVKAIIQTENAPWNPNAFGDANKGGSYGLMQILSATAQSLGCANWNTNVESNIDCGVKYIRYLVDIQAKKNLAPDLRNIAAAYNCGEKAMNSDSNHVLFWNNPDNCWSKNRATNTRDYVNKVIATYNTLTNQLGITYIPGAETQTYATGVQTIKNVNIVYDSSQNKIRISWSPLENSNAKKYLIARYRNGNNDKSEEIQSTTYGDTSLIQGTEYQYTIKAIDDNYNVYGSVETQKISTPSDITIPT